MNFKLFKNHPLVTIFIRNEYELKMHYLQVCDLLSVPSILSQ